MSSEPRYIAIADHPLCSYKVGDILTTTIGNCGKQCFRWDITYNENIAVYPHLFRLLYWWEHRDIAELPEYLKLVLNNGYVVVHIQPVDYLDPKHMRWKFGGHALKDFIPSTEQAYITYQDSIK